MKPSRGDDGNCTTERLGPYTFKQKRGGHRLTTDTVLLADFVAPLGEGVRVVDLGTGYGPLPLMLAAKNPSATFVCVDIDDDALAVADVNIRANSLAERVKLIESDWRKLPESLAQGSFDLVVSNPPYVKAGSGRLSPDPMRAMARTEVFGTLTELVGVSAYLLKSGGSICYVYPFIRYEEMLRALKDNGLALSRLRFVHDRKGCEARVFLVEARFAEESDRINVEAPLYLAQ